MENMFNNKGSFAIVKYMDGGYKQISLGEKFDATLYSVYEKNTFIFIDQILYNYLDDDIKENMGASEEDQHLTPEEMLAKDVMYILMDQGFDKNEFIAMVETYTGKELKYLEIIDIHIIPKNI